FSLALERSISSQRARRTTSPEAELAARAEADRPQSRIAEEITENNTAIVVCRIAGCRVTLRLPYRRLRRAGAEEWEDACRRTFVSELPSRKTAWPERLRIQGLCRIRLR